MSIELKEAAQRALDDICGAKLCGINSMSSRHEMIRLMDCAIDELRAALALQPAQAAQAVPMTGEQRHEIICRYDEGKTYSDLVGIILATEAKHGITAQAKKEGA